MPNNIVNRESQIFLSHATDIAEEPQYFYYTRLDSVGNVILDNNGNPILLSYNDVINISTNDGYIDERGFAFDITGNPYDPSINATIPLSYQQVNAISYGGYSAGFEADNVTPLNPYIYLYLEPIPQGNLSENQKVLVFPLGIGPNSDVYFYGYIKSVTPSSYIGFTNVDISIYNQILQYITPLYSQYVVKLLEADTYFTYNTFGRETQVSNTVEDISF
jgi:hypothetical protein